MEGSTATMGTRRYTPAMGAVETMEEFFEKLNAGDREGAVAMMDEKTEMRVHVGDNVQTLRGVERVGGWFLRSDTGLRMIPGDIRDTGTPTRRTSWWSGRARRPSTSTRHSGSRPGGSPPSTSRRASDSRGLLARDPDRPAQAEGDGDASAGTSSVSGNGMMISSPTRIRFGFLIVSLFAASRASRVTLNCRAILERVSPALIV